MSPTSRTKRTRRLDFRPPTFEYWPDTGASSTRWPRASALLDTFDLHPYAWQEYLARKIHAVRPDGRWAYPAVSLSVPRQSGKTFLLMAIVLTRAILYPETTVIWTAHQFKVSRETFDEMVAMLKANDAIHPHIDLRKGITTAAGNEVIRFRNKSRIIFAARERGAIRGFHEVDLLILDECQRLSNRAMADLLPTMNESPNPQRLYTGTPPRPIDDGDNFTRTRSRAYDGTLKRGAYVEYAVPPEYGRDDHEGWYIGNPSLGVRNTSVEDLEALRDELSQDDDFDREALGRWDSIDSTDVIPAEHFAGLMTPAIYDDPSLQIAVGIDVSPDRSSASIGVALWQGPEVVRVEVARHVRLAGDQTMAGIVSYVVGLCNRRKVRSIIIDTVGPAAALIEPLRAAGLLVTAISTAKVCEATAMFYDRAMGRTLTHPGDATLATAVKGASFRKVQDSVAWSRKGSIDITPLVAVTFALYGLVMTAPAQAKKQPRISTTYYGF